MKQLTGKSWLNEIFSICRKDGSIDWTVASFVALPFKVETFMRLVTVRVGDFDASQELDIELIFVAFPEHWVRPSEKDCTRR